MTDNVIDVAFNHLINVEGGYVNDPKDPGGETKYGISKRAYPDEDIKNLTIDRAKFLFCRDYWYKTSCDILPDCLSIVVSSMAYNSGVRRAKILLQRSMGLPETGNFDKTFFNKIESYKGNKPLLTEALKSYHNECLSFYKKLDQWNRYGRGWTNRLNSNLDLAMKYT